MISDLIARRGHGIDIEPHGFRQESKYDKLNWLRECLVGDQINEQINKDTRNCGIFRTAAGSLGHSFRSAAHQSS